MVVTGSKTNHVFQFEGEPKGLPSGGSVPQLCENIQKADKFPAFSLEA